MSEPVVLNLKLPEVKVEDILRAEGNDFSKRPPRQSLLKLYDRVLTEISALADMKAVWTEVEVAGSSETEVFLKGGTLSSKLLARMAGKARRLILFAMTIGGAVDDKISEYQRDGKMAYAFALDSAASVVVSKGASEAMGKIEEDCHREGLQTTFPMGPGHSYWKGLEDLRVIFGYLKPELAGISLNESNLMIPRKSVCMVLGIGDDIPAVNGKTHCDFCSLKKTCQLAQENR